MQFTKTPAIPYLKTIRLFAFQKGLPFWTWKQIKAVLKLYNEQVAKNQIPC